MKSRTGYLIIVIISSSILNSCYYRQPIYSFEQSSGGVLSGSSCYYLAQVKEYRNPKGISRFPDGGQTKEIRQLFGLFKTDSISGITVLEARLGDVYGWPVRFKTRLEKNNSDIAIGIVNINQPDSVNGIYLFNIDSGKILKYSDEEALPALAITGSRIAYCSNKILSVEDYSSKAPAATYPVEITPVFISWSGEQEILLFCSEPFRVLKLNLLTGRVDSSEVNYLANYKQELGAAEIHDMVKMTSSDLRRLLDTR